MDTFFAVSAPGLEPLTALELNRLGLLRTEPQALPAERPGSSQEGGGFTFEGGIPFEGGLTELYRANLHLRTASRVLVRLGEFYAAAFPELRKKASRLPWERYLQPGRPVGMHVTCRKSRLYHSDAVAQRVAGAIADRLGKTSALLKTTESDPAEPPQLVIVRLVNDRCTISIDSSGPLLHRRGYRLATAKAPLRETLAAAMLLASGWDPASPLLDPFCGSGTIPIEAALMRLNLPPGRSRSFAFMDWPTYDPRPWKTLLAEIQPANISALPPIQASDRDEGAIRLAQANAERAEIHSAVEFTCRAVSSIQPPPCPGWVVTNPPYGIRVSANKDLRNLYAQFGKVLRLLCRGWQVAILCSDPILLGHTDLKLETSFTFVNGGVNVRMGRGRV